MLLELATQNIYFFWILGKIQFYGMMLFQNFSELSKCIGKVIKQQKNAKLMKKSLVPTQKPNYKR